MAFKLKRYTCHLELTVATRIVAILCLVMSLVSMGYLFNDMYDGNFEVTKQCAHFFGYDWKEIYASSISDADKDKLVWIVMLVYFLVNLITSFILILGAAISNWCCAIPWLTFTIIATVVKMTTLVVYLTSHSEQVDAVFTVCSFLFCALMGFWWGLVFLTATSWLRKRKSHEISPRNVEPKCRRYIDVLSPASKSDSEVGKFMFMNRSNGSLVEMPAIVPYDANSYYTTI